MTFFGIESKGTEETVLLENPFRPEYFSRAVINIYADRSNMFREGKLIEVTVYFIIAETRGSKKFYADNLLEVVTKITKFMEAL